jgi:hypothetical protein
VHECLGRLKPSSRSGGILKLSWTSESQEHDQPPPQAIISLNDSNGKNDTSNRENGTAANAAAVLDGAVSSQEQVNTSTKTQGRVKKIRNWLIAQNFL